MRENKIVAAGWRVYMKFFEMGFFEEEARKANADLVQFRDEDEQAFIETIGDADALLLIDRQIREEHLRVLKKCRIILALTVGTDYIDVSGATKHGIIVSNVPAYCTNDVSVHAFTLLLGVQRKLKLLLKETALGGWDYNICTPITEIPGKQLGIIGLGKIGRSLVSKAKAFGLKVCAYDPYLSDDLFDLLGVTRCYELEEILSTSDFVSLHVPLTQETLHMINGRSLGWMKKSAVLINTCRGKVVDEAALHTALVEGRLAGAGLDVLEQEPPQANNPLLTLDSTLVTPHVAWYSEESTGRLKQQGMDEIVRVLQGQRPRFIVNPELLYQQTQEGRGSV